MKVRTKTVETIHFTVQVQHRDIEEGKCMLVAKCMHKVAIERALRKLDPKGGDHKTRCDGQIVKFNLGGYRYLAILPKTAKLNLLTFDKERRARAKAEKLGEKFVSKVKPHSYRLEAERGTKTQPFTRERMAQVYEARRRRAEEGRPDKRKYDIRHRIEGLGAV
jgi:hypothetical protein